MMRGKSGRSERTTGEYRGRYRGSGPAAQRASRTRTELNDAGVVPLRGRGSGVPYLEQGLIKGALHRIGVRQDQGRPRGPSPHPTKRGPGRV